MNQNKDIIESKIENVVDLLEKLKAILMEYENNLELQEFLFYAAEKKAEEIVESATSINQELLKTKEKISSSYYDSFIDLKCFSVFDQKELIELAKTAGFRNRLAHDYLTINQDIALKTMKHMLKIYPKYLSKIKFMISKSQS